MYVSSQIQIQHLLKLNIMELKDTVKLMYSNTTFVKVKYMLSPTFMIEKNNSNTTFVKVKLCSRMFPILSLMYSNTTFVKVK